MQGAHAAEGTQKGTSPSCVRTGLSSTATRSDRRFFGVFSPPFCGQKCHLTWLCSDCRAIVEPFLWSSLLLRTTFCLVLQPDAVCFEVIFSHG